MIMISFQIACPGTKVHTLTSIKPLLTTGASVKKNCSWFSSQTYQKAFLCIVFPPRKLNHHNKFTQDLNFPIKNPTHTVSFSQQFLPFSETRKAINLPLVVGSQNFQWLNDYSDVTILERKWYTLLFLALFHLALVLIESSPG